MGGQRYQGDLSWIRGLAKSGGLVHLPWRQGGGAEGGGTETSQDIQES